MYIYIYIHSFINLGTYPPHAQISITLIPSHRVSGFVASWTQPPRGKRRDGRIGVGTSGEAARNGDVTRKNGDLTRKNTVIKHDLTIKNGDFWENIGISPGKLRFSQQRLGSTWVKSENWDPQVIYQLHCLSWPTYNVGSCISPLLLILNTPSTWFCIGPSHIQILRRFGCQICCFICITLCRLLTD